MLVYFCWGISTVPYVMMQCVLLLEALVLDRLGQYRVEKYQRYHERERFQYQERERFRYQNGSNTQVFIYIYIGNQLKFGEISEAERLSADGWVSLAAL